MPRSGWLALGGVLAALGIPALAAGREVAITAALTSVALLLTWFGRKSRPGAIAAAIAVGAVVVAMRMTVAPADSADLAPPSGRGPWEMVVETVGSPRDGMQVATLRLAPAQVPGGGVLLAATMPRYPPVEPGDVILLCSDGLSDMVVDEEIHSTLSTLQSNLQLAATQLVQLANDSGGRDNVSVILVRILKDFAAPTGWFAKFRAWFR